MSDLFYPRKPYQLSGQSKVDYSHAINRGIVSWLPMDESSNILARDVVRNGAYGSWVNGSGWGTGARGGCSIFTAGTNYISVPHFEALNFPIIALSFWIRPASFTNWQCPFGHSDDVAQGWYLDINAAAKISFYSPVGGSHFTVEGTLLANVWQHVVIIHDGVNDYYYINGALTDTIADASAIVAHTGPLIIGSISNFNEKFDGRLADLRIWNRKLDLVEIKSLYSKRTNYGSINPYSKRITLLPTSSIGEGVANLSGSGTLTAVSGVTREGIFTFSASGTLNAVSENAGTNPVRVNELGGSPLNPAILHDGDSIRIPLVVGTNFYQNQGIAVLDITMLDNNSATAKSLWCTNTGTQFLFDGGDGKIKLTDGTNTATADIGGWVINDRLIITAYWTGAEMALSVSKNDGVWIDSLVATYDGAFPVGANFIFCNGSTDTVLINTAQIFRV